MKKILLILFLSFPILAVHAQNAPGKKGGSFKLSKRISPKDYLPGVLIVKFKAEAGSSTTLSSKQNGHTLKSKSVTSLKKMFPEHGTSVKTLARKKDDSGLERIYEVKINPSKNIEEVINELLADPQVEYAEPRYIHRSNFIPNDPLFPQQPYLHQVRAPQAWDLIRNVPSSIIAIVDSGSEITHPDLAANIYFNPLEVPNNGVDDDGNGKIDDYRGWDFAGASGTNEDNNPNVVGPSNAHGVHVSGIASAVTNNGIGVSSVAFNCAKLLIVKAGPDDSGTDISHGYEGIKYAADMGAHIINCSWGSAEGGNFGRDVVNYAINKGCLIVAAGGNAGQTSREYPAGYQGVMAVASLSQSNSKAGSSNFGSYISIAAPGEDILSTVYDKKYDTSSGTSMATPVVSSAAALVKAYRLPLNGQPLNMQQIGELVRVTADNIDVQNPEYPWQLGQGRLNVLRALTENPSAVRIQRVVEEERNASSNTNPDTLYLYLDLKNFLYPVNGLKLTLTSPDPNLVVLNPLVTIPSLGTLETRTQIGPFKVSVLPGTPSNTDVDFRLEYANNDNSYQDFEHLSVTVAEDYINIHTPSVSTTITSNGRIGYSEPSEAGGLGFVYKGEQLLFEAALMIGSSASKLSNNARAIGDWSDEHFLKTVEAHKLVDNADSVVAQSEFEESNHTARLEITVKHKMTAFKKSPNDKYIIAEYEVFNTTNSQLSNVHVGLFTDWDIEGTENATRYDASERLAYVYNVQQATAPYGAVKLLNRDAPPIYYPLSYQLAGNPLTDDDFTREEKWETLSNGVKAQGMGTTTAGIDVSFVSGNGPYTIPANGSIKVAFALIGGDSFQDLQTSAVAAQEKYNLINNVGPGPEITQFEMLAYPNPIFAATEGSSTIEFALPESGNVSLDLYNLAGQRVRNLITSQPFSKGIHYFKYDLSGGYFTDLTTGVYFYRMRFNNQFKSRKINIIR